MNSLKHHVTLSIALCCSIDLKDQNGFFSEAPCSVDLVTLCVSFVPDAAAVTVYMGQLRCISYIQQKEQCPEGFAVQDSI